MCQKKFILPLAISATIVFWASAFVAIRAALTEVSPVPLAALRFFIASIVLIPIAWRYQLRRPPIRDLPLLFLVGVMGFTLYNIALNWGETLVTAASSCFIVNGGNLITAVLAACFLRETISPYRWAAMLISLGGIAIIALGESDSWLQLNFGTLLVFLAACFQSIQFVLIKSLSQRYSSLELLCYPLWLGTLAFLPFLDSPLSLMIAPSLSSFLSILYLGIFPGIIAYFSWSFVLSLLDASQAAAYLFIIPIIALILAWFWLGETPSLTAILGGGITLIGIVASRALPALPKKDSPTSAPVTPNSTIKQSNPVP